MALVDAGDVNHAPAADYQAVIVGKYRLLASNYILDELYTLILIDLGHRYVKDFKYKLDRLAADQLLEVVWVDRALAEEAWSVFERFNHDKKWSFTDCVSYAIMKQRGIEEAFTFDHHFEQMGFLRRP